MMQLPSPPDLLQWSAGTDRTLRTSPHKECFISRGAVWRVTRPNHGHTLLLASRPEWPGKRGSAFGELWLRLWGGVAALVWGEYGGCGFRVDEQDGVVSQGGLFSLGEFTDDEGVGCLDEDE
jgi:hypothetical protein